MHFVSENATVQWLGEESMRRYQKLQPTTHVEGKSYNVAFIRKTHGGAILDPDDNVEDVLDDNDFVSISKLNVKKLYAYIIRFYNYLNVTFSLMEAWKAKSGIILMKYEL